MNLQRRLCVMVMQVTDLFASVLKHHNLSTTKATPKAHCRIKGCGGVRTPPCKQASKLMPGMANAFRVKGKSLHPRSQPPMDCRNTTLSVVLLLHHPLSPSYDVRRSIATPWIHHSFPPEFHFPKSPPAALLLAPFPTSRAR